jgi:hypothetical protein
MDFAKKKKRKPKIPGEEKKKSVPRLDGLCFNLLHFFSTALLKSYFSGPWADNHQETRQV